MDFKYAQKEYNRLKNLFEKNKISPAFFEEAVSKLVVLDANGHTWQIGVNSGKWYRFDGRNWVEDTPSENLPATAVAPVEELTLKVDTTPPPLGQAPAETIKISAPPPVGTAPAETVKVSAPPPQSATVEMPRSPADASSSAPPPTVKFNEAVVSPPPPHATVRAAPPPAAARVPSTPPVGLPDYTPPPYEEKAKPKIPVWIIILIVAGLLICIIAAIVAGVYVYNNYDIQLTSAPGPLQTAGVMLATASLPPALRTPTHAVAAATLQNTSETSNWVQLTAGYFTGDDSL